MRHDDGYVLELVCDAVGADDLFLALSDRVVPCRAKERRPQEGLRESPPVSVSTAAFDPQSPESVITGCDPGDAPRRVRTRLKR